MSRQKVTHFSAIKTRYHLIQTSIIVFYLNIAFKIKEEKKNLGSKSDKSFNASPLLPFPPNNLHCCRSQYFINYVKINDYLNI